MNTGLSSLSRRTNAPAISWLMGLTLTRPNLISLAAGFTDNQTLPVARARALLRDLLSEKHAAQDALQYGTTAGAPELRRLTALRVRELDLGKPAAKPAPAYAPERMVITNGSQQLLYLVSECLCDPGDIVLVEDPTYFVFLGIAQSHGLRCCGVRIESDGLNLDELEQTLKKLKASGDLPRVKMFYTISYFQNPTGVTTSIEKKRKTLEILRRYERAAGHPIYYLEDAAYRELSFDGKSGSSTLSLKGAAERVIYTGTYSKPFATGARVGFGILPEPLYTCVIRAKGNHDFGTSNLLQELMRRAIESGEYVQHLASLQARYRNKAFIMRETMRKHFPDSVEWMAPAGGLYFWPRLPKGVSSGTKSKFFKAALARDVLYVPGELCYADDPSRRKPNREMRISFGGATEKEIVTGIQRLGAVISEFH